MGKESLVFPEEKTMEVVAVVRAGVEVVAGLSDETARELTKWCDQMERYVMRMGLRMALNAKLSEGHAGCDGDEGAEE